MTTTMTRRYRAVRTFTDRVRQLRDQLGETELLLDALKPVLTELAACTDLFPSASFPTKPGRQGTLYELSVDPDRRIALYASTGNLGKYQPPHDHRTWSLISGVFGEEHNVYYERTDDRSMPGRGTLRCTGEMTITKGNANGMLGDAFHHIEVVSDGGALHLHLYGLALDLLHNRIYFEAPDGGEYKRFMAVPDLHSPLVSPADLDAMLGDGEELAALDVREDCEFAGGHLFAASPIPLSRLELLVPRLVPNPAVRIVVIGASDEQAQQAAHRLRRSGHRNVAVLAGGIAGWRDAGYRLFEGTSVPSKTFGEFVAHTAGTPQIEPAEVDALRQSDDVVVVDCRPEAEFTAMSVPGAVNCPGVDILPRVQAMGLASSTTVVVNCAGRTRAIIAAQSLIDAGVENRVVALRDGIMGWMLDGRPVDRGRQATVAPPTEEALGAPRAAAADLARRHRIPFVDAATVAALAANRERSLYVFDVRQPDQYHQGHRPGSLSAPGGQLIQTTDRYMAVRNARVVLVDRDRVQAVIAAHWLRRMGWDAYVLADGLDGAELEVGDGAPARRDAAVEVDGMGPDALDAVRSEPETVIIDCDSSLAYRDAHIPGARHAMRSRLRDAAAEVATARLVVFTSADGTLAQLAAADAVAMDLPAAYLSGGTRAWAASGRPLVADGAAYLTGTDDVWYRPYERADSQEAAMKDYLAWEEALLDTAGEEIAGRFKATPA